jgi:hypothetical protein
MYCGNTQAPAAFLDFIVWSAALAASSISVDGVRQENTGADQPKGCRQDLGHRRPPWLMTPGYTLSTNLR